MHRGRPVMLAALLAMAIIAPSSAGADVQPIPGAGSPDGGPILDAEPPAAPDGAFFDWDGRPGDVAGAWAYAGDEFILTDHPFDDRGADTEGGNGREANPLELYSLTEGANAATSPAGDYTYPSDEAFVNNGADITEVRVAADAEAWYVIVVLNSLLDPSRTAIEARLQHEDDDVAPAVLLIHGDEGSLAGAAVDVLTDSEQNTFEARIPRALYDPGESEHQLFVGAGLWNPGASTWLDPDPASDGAPYFDLAYTLNEGFDTYWRDGKQSVAIATGDFSENQAWVDFGRLAHPCGDCDLHLYHPRQRCQIILVLYRCASTPRAPITRVFRSGQALGEGVIEQSRYDQDASWDYKLYRSRYQPYSLYAAAPKRPGPQPLILLLHFLGGNHMSYPITSFGRGLSGSDASIQQWADELGAIVAMPLARGEAGWYEGEAEKDVFEVWRDVAEHYDVDRERVYLMGMSMGGYGTWRLGSLYPDQFAKAIVWSGPVTPYSIWPYPAPVMYPQPNPPICDGETEGCGLTLMSVFGNVVNIPYLVIHGGADELVPSTGAEEWMRVFGEYGSPYRYVFYPTRRHETSYPGSTGHWVKDWLLDLPTRVTDPAHVRYSVVRDFFQPAHALSYTGAYWVEDLELAGDVGGGTFDARVGPYDSSAPADLLAGADTLGPWRLTGRSARVAGSQGSFLEMHSTGIERATVKNHAFGEAARTRALYITTDVPLVVRLIGDFTGVQVTGASFTWDGGDLIVSVPDGITEVELTRP